MRVERQDVGDVLIWADHHHGALPAVDAARVEDVLARLQVGSEDFLVVLQAKGSLLRKQEGWHVVGIQFPVALLEDGADIKNGIGVGSGGRVAPDRRVFGFGQETAQFGQPGVWCPHQ